MLYERMEQELPKMPEKSRRWVGEMEEEAMARLVFMGTPQFAVPVLLALAGRHEVVGVVTHLTVRPGEEGPSGHRQ
jgi:hypothetical protein